MVRELGGGVTKDISWGWAKHLELYVGRRQSNPSSTGHRPRVSVLVSSSFIHLSDSTDK